MPEGSSLQKNWGFTYLGWGDRGNLKWWFITNFSRIQLAGLGAFRQKGLIC